MFVSQRLWFMEFVLLQIPNMGDCYVGSYVVRGVVNHFYCPSTIITYSLQFNSDVDQKFSDSKI